MNDREAIVQAICDAAEKAGFSYVNEYDELGYRCVRLQTDKGHVEYRFRESGCGYVDMHSKAGQTARGVLPDTWPQVIAESMALAATELL